MLLRLRTVSFATLADAFAVSAAAGAGEALGRAAGASLATRLGLRAGEDDGTVWVVEGDGDDETEDG